MQNPAVILPFKDVSETFDYFPETGKVYLKGKDKPLSSLTKNRKAIRAQIQTDDFYKDSTAHAVAWVLLTGRDLMKNEKPCHINDNKFDNRAVNLYLEELDYNENSTTYLPDTKLARLLFPHGERLSNGLWKASGSIYGDYDTSRFVGARYKDYLFNQEMLRTGARPAYLLNTPLGRAAMEGIPVIHWDEFFSRTTIDLDDFVAWLEKEELTQRLRLQELRTGEKSPWLENERAKQRLLIERLVAEALAPAIVPPAIVPPAGGFYL